MKDFNITSILQLNDLVCGGMKRAVNAQAVGAPIFVDIDIIVPVSTAVLMHFIPFLVMSCLVLLVN